MNWYQNAIFYQIYLRAFCDKDGNGHGDFAGLRDKIPYLEWLGVDCIWLMPIYPSPLKDDGYDVASFYGIHPTYGLLEDFKMTVQELHRRGIRVIVDLVVNHTSDQHPWFQEARRSKSSPLHDYYVWNNSPDKYAGVPIIFEGVETSNWAYNEATQEYYWHRFYSSQPDLNYENPAVQDEMLNIIKFWCDLGVDGFRVDAVPYLFEEEGTLCENLPPTHDYLRRMRAMLDEQFPNTLLLAEANLWPRDLLNFFGTEAAPEFQMCFHFPLMPRLYMALAQADRSKVVDILNDTPALPKGAQWATFLRNHDELTLQMVDPDEREWMRETYAPDPTQRIFSGIRRRLAPLMGNDRRKIELMYSLLLTLTGSPVLYYGDEIGMGDDVTLFDRNGVRTPMQWDDSPNGGFSTAMRENLYTPAINDPVYGYKAVNVAAQQADSRSLLNSIRALLQARKQNPVLGMGSLAWWAELPPQALCFWRTDDSTSLLALHNLSDNELILDLPSGTFDDAFTLRQERISGQIMLPPFGYRWLVKA